MVDHMTTATRVLAALAHLRADCDTTESALTAIGETARSASDGCFSGVSMPMDADPLGRTRACPSSAMMVAPARAPHTPRQDRPQTYAHPYTLL
eukprot:707708-Rhodomonas_salina.1